MQNVALHAIFCVIIYHRVLLHNYYDRITINKLLRNQTKNLIIILLYLDLFAEQPNQLLSLHFSAQITIYSQFKVQNI